MVQGRLRQPEGGAAAVEFALVSLLLFTVLFGILQYGIGFFEQQAASSTVREAARLAAVGIDDCPTFVAGVKTAAQANGLSMNSNTTVHATFNPSGSLQPGGTVTVTMTFTPTRVGLAWIPYPSGDSFGNLGTQAQARVEQLGSVKTSC